MSSPVSIQTSPASGSMNIGSMARISALKGWRMRVGSAASVSRILSCHCGTCAM